MNETAGSIWKKAFPLRYWWSTLSPTFRKTFYEALGWSAGLLPLVLIASWVF